MVINNRKIPDKIQFKNNKKKNIFVRRAYKKVHNSKEMQIAKIVIRRRRFELYLNFTHVARVTIRPTAAARFSRSHRAKDGYILFCSL